MVLALVLALSYYAIQRWLSNMVTSSLRTMGLLRRGSTVLTACTMHSTFDSPHSNSSVSYYSHSSN